ncbi:MAG: hypothetical protein ABI333_29600 [bacterium]
MACSDDDLPHYPDEYVYAAVYSPALFPRDFHDGDRGDYLAQYVDSYIFNPDGRFEEDEHWYKLCTDSLEQAVEWSRMKKELHLDPWSPPPPEPVDQRQTGKYFEIDYGESPHLYGDGLHRVDRCSYIDRTVYDRLSPGNLIGIFGRRPVTPENVKELVEYLWCTSHRLGFDRLLDSDIQVGDETITYWMDLTYLVQGDWGMCDEIIVFRRTYRISRTTGAITLEWTDIQSVQGVCEPDFAGR